MNSRKHPGNGKPMALCLAVLLASAFGQPAAAQSGNLQDFVADCGKQARAAGFTGAAMTAFIKECLAKKQGRDNKDSQSSQSQ
ncbi:MAG TPA: hypothetical protein VGB36_06800 [Gammaproteobacteria bacterium]|jgi:hypothetical protein